MVFIVSVSCKDILDCIQTQSGDKKLRIGGPDACEVEPHSKPWIVDLRPYVTCGGTLIAKNIVLTARHCLEGKQVDAVTVGDHDMDDYDKGEITINIKDRIFPDIEDCSGCDFAILVAEESVQTNEYVQIANLPNADEPCSEKDLVVCGWGADAFNCAKHMCDNKFLQCRIKWSDNMD